MSTPRKQMPSHAAGTQSPLTLNVKIDPLVAAVRRHVKLSPSATRLITGEFMRLFQGTVISGDKAQASAKTEATGHHVLSTQAAADLLGVSRPYIVARIDAGDIPLHQQVGNQRRVLKSALLAWHRREQRKRRKALGLFSAELDTEIFPQ